MFEKISSRVIAGVSFAATIALSAVPGAARAQVVYSNDFETNTNGFTASGSLTSLSRVALPTDSNDPSLTNTSTWLGKIGDGVAKGGAPEVATLSLTGLTVGHTYSVNFDLLIGASWDGAASGYGPDSWSLTADSTTLVNTTFSNVLQGTDAGAYSPQNYSDALYTDANPADAVNPRWTGADQTYATNSTNYAPDYSIYYFGHGAGNPVLTYVAAATTSSLAFERYGTSTDSPDEYWALDNVSVTDLTGGTSSAPEPSAILLLISGASPILSLMMRRSRGANSRSSSTNPA